MCELYDETEQEEEEVTRGLALERFQSFKDILTELKTCYPKEYKFCFNSRRDLDDLAYSYLNEENQKYLHH